MKLLLHIASRRISFHYKKNLAQSAAVFVSVFAICTFLYVSFGMNLLIQNLPSSSLDSTSEAAVITVNNIKGFLKEILYRLVVISAVATLLSLITLYIYSRVRAEEEKHFYATLFSVGATRNQTKILSIIESLYLYFIPIFLAALLAVFPAKSLVNYLGVSFSVAPFSFSLSPLVIVTAALLTLCVIIFTLAKNTHRDSAISLLKRHNAAETGREHSYRKSYTFRSMPVEARIAKKSVEYYAAPYRRIGVVFVVTCLYPVLAVMFFVMLSGVKLDVYSLVDTDVSTQISQLFERVAAVGASAFLILFLFAAFQLIQMIRTQNRIRKDTLLVYKSVGMTDSGIKRVLKYEYSSVAFKAAIALIFVLAILISLFSNI